MYAALGPGEDFLGYQSFALHPADYAQALGIFSPPWLGPLISPLAVLPGRWGFVLLLGLTLFAGLFAARTLGGKPLVLLLSAQMSWVLWWGQIDALPLLALALAFLGYTRHSWRLLAVALVLAAVKPHVAGIPVIALWWWSTGSRSKSLAAAAALVALSLAVWGNWPAALAERLVPFSQSTSYRPWNATLGPLALPLIIPALLVPLERPQRLLVLTATAMLVSPYMPYYSTLLLLAFPLPWPLLGLAFLGYLPSLIGTTLAWKGVVLLPLGVLAWVYLSAARSTRTSEALRSVAAAK